MKTRNTQSPEAKRLHAEMVAAREARDAHECNMGWINDARGWEDTLWRLRGEYSKARKAYQFEAYGETD